MDTKSRWMLLGSLVVVCACVLHPARARAAQPAIGSWGFDLTAMDTGVAAGDDFNRHVNGGWLARTQIPADRSRWGTFDQLLAKSESDLHEIVEGIPGDPAATPEARKVADFYRAYLDTKSIEAAQLKPVAAELREIRALSNRAAIARFMGDPSRPYGGPIAFFPYADPKDPVQHAIQVTQSGLGLPDRDFYLDPSPSFAATRASYRHYIETLLALAHQDSPAKSADAVLALETEIARVSWPYEKRRDYDATYHAMTRAQALAAAPGFPMDEMFAAGGLPVDYDRFVVAEDTAVRDLGALYARTPIATWRAYLAFHCLDAYADVLPQAFDDASFEMHGKVLNGQPQKRERWKRAIAAVNGGMGDALGQLYVARHFTADAEARMKELTDNLLAAYRQRISRLDWMSPGTREAALRKLASFRVMIGHPDHWRNYDALEVRADDPVGNRRRAAVHEWHRLMVRLRDPVDRSEWGLLAQEVNAENLGVFNAVIFPAAILQPPFFDPAADPAVNYGAIGGVIGHEISHSFDDQGAKLDETGRLRPWWQPGDVDHFKALGQRMIAQYDAFEPLPGVHVRGANTIGENIADLGGLSAAHEAYELSLHGASAPVLDGYTGEQRLFLGWAQAWREAMREEALRNRIVSDEHSPAQYRVNGVVRNVDAWYEAFKVDPHQALYLAPADRVHIW